MTRWSGPVVDRLWIKSRLGDGVLADLSSDGARLAALPGANTTPLELDCLTPFGSPGSWADRLPHFKPGVDPGPVGHLQSEYMVPRHAAVHAMNLLRAMADWIDPLLLTTEIRSMAADPFWLSPSYGHDSIGIHFSWKRDIAAIDAISAEIEARLLPLGGRPHWGKIMHTDAAGLAPLYPKLGEFLVLARRLDPTGKFRNRFLDRHVFTN